MFCLQPKVLAHPLPASFVQARYQALGLGFGKAQGCLFGAGTTQPESARGIGLDRAGLRSPCRGLVSNQAIAINSACLQGDRYRVL